MIIHPSLFVPALLLLVFPADRLLSSFVELRNFDSFHTLDRAARFRAWWWVPALWIDPWRGFGGAWLLTRSLDLHFKPWDVLPPFAYSLAIAVMVLGVGAQLVTRREPGAFLAPIGFVTGVLASLAPWTVTAIVVTIAITCMVGLRNFYAFFVAGFAAVLFLGFVMSTGPGWIVPALVALGLPVAVGLIAGRTLELPTRSAAGQRHSAGES
ncbi:MAG: hypothetical protein ACRD4Q_08635 [Candidatus Acidiferrales bacterium]